MIDLVQRLLPLAGAAGGGPGRSGPALHVLLGDIVGAAEGPDIVEQDTLGMRNQRLLRLYRRLCGERLEACASCPACCERIEFDVPMEPLLSLPAPAADTTVIVDGAVFRLPRVSDFEQLESLDDVPLQLARLCLVEGEPAFSAGSIGRLGERIDRADPAGNIALSLDCSECGTGFPVALDIAPLVADALARLADGLVRDIDTIAAAYGWTETEILALPPERRRLYVSLIVARRLPGRGRPHAVEQAV